MVARPARLLDRGDLAGAEAAFEEVLARPVPRGGRSDVAEADRLTAFGLALFMRDEDAPRAAETKRLSLDYFRRAVPAYRAAFGRNSLEVALAIGTWAHAALDVHPDDPPAGIEAELADAHRIFTAAYGRNDAAAAATLLRRAQVLGAPSRTRGDPAAIAAAAALFRETMFVFDAADREAANFELLPGELGVALMHVQHGRIGEAVAAVDDAAATAGRRMRDAGPESSDCVTFKLRLFRLVQLMTARGHGATAEAMWHRHNGRPGCGPD
ncbi:MAG TPA: hypothetical protein VF552_03950 [Allosphingosinicella sp.]|jgi:hypothetical protein